MTAPAATMTAADYRAVLGDHWLDQLVDAAVARRRANPGLPPPPRPPVSPAARAVAAAYEALDRAQAREAEARAMRSVLIGGLESLDAGQGLGAVAGRVATSLGRWSR